MSAAEVGAPPRDCDCDRDRDRDWDAVPRASQEPDFDNLLAVLHREEPSRPTLFEFFMNGPLNERLAGPNGLGGSGERPEMTASLLLTAAFRAAGYDYATVSPPGCRFPAGDVDQIETRSLNAGAVITDRASLEAYPWPDMAAGEYGHLDEVGGHLPPGMKLITPGPMGVLENVIRLVGYDRLCYIIADDAGLAQDIFDGVGSRLIEYYERVVQCPAVGAVIGNDDWGFKTQTMLAPDDMRRFVFPWHARLVEVAHAAGRPAILHSCGNRREIWDDIIEAMDYDGVHSYEDAIQPVEEAYEEFGRRIAILGGIDVDFVIRETPQAVYERSAAMLERADRRGSYALGTGNSVPAYVPDDHYLAMIRACHDARGAGS